MDPSTFSTSLTLPGEVVCGQLPSKVVIAPEDGRHRPDHGGFIGIFRGIFHSHMGVSENSVPLNPMVNDYPY